MSVASHLAISPSKYDVQIRTLIPLYDELIAEVARALEYAARPIRTIADLGVGTGALARACLERTPGARVWGIDADSDMMAIASTRLTGLSRRVRMTRGSFLDEALPACDAIVASYSLHHIRTRRAKQALPALLSCASSWRSHHQWRLCPCVDAAWIRARSRCLVLSSRQDVRQPRTRATRL
jgi:SAM-dependent methyltransferase